MFRVDTHLASLFGLSVPPFVALLCTIAFVVFLFARDIRERPNVTGAIWIPYLWLLISSSRPVSMWLQMLGLPVSGATSVEEGSPLDAGFYFAMIAIGLCVLGKRKVSFTELIRDNGWLVAFLVYCLIATIWSDYPFVAFKRWIKICGLPIMALVILTEPDFEVALTTLMKRLAYSLLPFSILVIKYYVEIGHRTSDWGEDMNTGIALGKNQLGVICMILGVFFVWLFIQTWRWEKSRARTNELRLILVLLLMIAWLFHSANSVTPLVCSIIASALIFMLARGWLSGTQIGRYILFGSIVLVAAELAFGWSETAIGALGRDVTLTGRTALWSELMKKDTEPVLGVGFESFWLGDRSIELQGKRSWQPTEAHNGYLETYLNLGAIGVCMLVGFLIATFRKIRRSFFEDCRLADYRLAFFAAVVIYNLTEVSFRGTHPIWAIFYLVAIDYWPLRYADQVVETMETDRELQLAGFPE